MCLLERLDRLPVDFIRQECYDASSESNGKCPSKLGLRNVCTVDIQLHWTFNMIYCMEAASNASDRAEPLTSAAAVYFSKPKMFYRLVASSS